jgi:hypothetical protein
LKSKVGSNQKYRGYSKNFQKAVSAILQGCGSGSVLGIRGQENKEISVEKMHLFFKKMLPLKSYEIAPLFEKNFD